MRGRAGATILEVTGDTSMKSDVSKVVVHLFLAGQFFGFTESVSQA
jgi:hypothetical protein